MPSLFTNETSSLKKIIPTKITAIKFRIVNIEMAFDKYSYRKENAHPIVPIVYKTTPIQR